MSCSDAASLDRLQRELARYTYRPGWTLEIQPEPSFYSLGALLIRYQTEDARNPGTLGTFESLRSIPEMLAEYPDFFGRWLQQQLLDIEHHESREWLRRDGQLYDDPHATDARGTP